MSSVASQLSGSPASLWNPLRTGVVQIALGASLSPVVADTRITANSVILFQSAGASPDATANAFLPVLNAGVSFRVQAQAVATANADVRYWIMKY